MKILVLDDNPHRLSYYQRYYSSLGYDVDLANNYLGCITALRSSHYDLVHLDHDLDDLSDDATYYYDSSGKKRFYTGLHVVDMILDMPDVSRPSQIVVHSVNPVGGRQMYSALKNAGIMVDWIPFNIDD